MLASFWKRAGIGFLMGMVIGNMIAWLTSAGGGAFYSAEFASRLGGMVPAAILQTLLSGLLGAGSMGSTVVYEIERWPLALSTAAHYLIIEAFYVPVALLLEWVDSLPALLISMGIQLIIFFIIWLIMYLRYKAQVRELNELLKKGKGGKNT